MAFPVALGILGGAKLGSMVASHVIGRRAKKRERSFQRMQHRAAVSAAERGLEQLGEDQGIERERLQQSLASRGVGTSSIADEQTGYQSRLHARQRAASEDRVALARKGQSVFKQGVRAERRLGMLGYLDDTLSLLGMLGANAGWFGQTQEAAAKPVGGPPVYNTTPFGAPRIA